MWTQKCESYAGQTSLQQKHGWHLLRGDVAAPNLSCYWISRRNVFQGLAPNCCSVQEAHHYFVREVKSKHCSSLGQKPFSANFQLRKCKMHGVLNAGYVLCISWWCKTICIYVYIYLCGYIEKYNKLMDIQNMYYIYIYIHMCLYDIWLPAGSLQRKLLTLCITPQRSGLSVMYNP